MIRLTIQDKDIVQTLRIEVDKAFVGRSPSNTIVLKDAAASRRHCMLRVSGGVVEVLDLNSRHGLKINGEPAKRAFLSCGDRVGIGSAEIRLDEIASDADTSSRFGGYLDDDAHLYTMRGENETGTAVATRTETSEATGATTEPAPESVPPDETSSKGDGSFADELYRVLRRSPAWMISMLVHTFILAILFQSPWVTPPDDEVANRFSSGMAERGQMLEDVQLAVEGRRKVDLYHRLGGVLPSEREIVEKVLAMVRTHC